MTDLRTRPRETTSRVGEAAAPRPLVLSTALVVAALLAGGLVLTGGLAVVGWLAGAGGSLGGALRVGATAWLTGHGAGLRVDGVTLGLVPLLGPVLVLLAARRGGLWAAATSAPAPSWWDSAVILLAGLVYGLAATGLALVGVPDGVAVSPARSGVAAGALAAVGVAAGLSRQRGWLVVLRDRLPSPVCQAVRGAAAALTTVLAAAALVTLLVIGLDVDQVVGLGSGLGVDPAGAGLLLLACLATLPNAVLWCASYLLGPGFAVGVATVISPAGVSVGALPAYPLLGALPTGEPSGWAAALLALPVAAGAVGGVVAERHLGAVRWWHTAGVGLAAGALAGLGLAGLLSIAGGAIGPDRLGVTGPVPLAGLVAVVALGLGGMLGGITARALTRGVPLPELEAVQVRARDLLSRVSRRAAG